MVVKFRFGYLVFCIKVCFSQSTKKHAEYGLDNVKSTLNNLESSQKHEKALDKLSAYLLFAIFVNLFSILFAKIWKSILQNWIECGIIRGLKHLRATLIKIEHRFIGFKFYFLQILRFLRPTK